MPGSSRRIERVQAAIPVHLEDGGEAVTRDLSPAGIFFVTEKEMAAGSSIRFTIEFENPGGNLYLDCGGEESLSRLRRRNRQDRRSGREDRGCRKDHRVPDGKAKRNTTTGGARMKRLTALICAVMGTMLALVPSVATAARGGNAGTTLAAYKTLDICQNLDGTWNYSGIVAVFNQGAVDTVGLNILDYIQNKAGNGPKFTNQYLMLNVTPTTDIVPGLTATGQVPAGTTDGTAVKFPYSFDGAPLPGTVRNDALVTILNHSNYVGTRFGPETKYTFVGSVPDCANDCVVPAPEGGPSFEGPRCDIPHCSGDPGAYPNCYRGCTLTLGYYGTSGGVDTPHLWPAPYSADDAFFLSGTTWGLVGFAGTNGYYILARQYVAAVLNGATEIVPPGVQSTIDQATAWFTSNPPSACDGNGSCGPQKDWAAVLDSYNNGIYPGDYYPESHCADGTYPPAP